MVERLTVAKRPKKSPAVTPFDPTAPLRYGSVCSGIEAATTAWHELGWKPVFYSEIEDFPNAVLKHRHPEVPNYGDMNKFKEWPDATIDVLVGGTPCQSFSIAGLRKGLDDPRGNLALVFLGLVDRYRPVWVVWENVPGVLSADQGRAFGSFVGGLAELGYGVAWRVLDAQYFGLAQRRKRVFVVGYSGNVAGRTHTPTVQDTERFSRISAAVLLEYESLSGDSAPRRKTGQRVAPSLTQSSKRSGGIGSSNQEVFSQKGEGFITKEDVCAETSPALVASGRGVERPGDTRGQDPVVVTETTPILEAGARTGKSTTDKRAGMGVGKHDDPMFALQAKQGHAVCVEVSPPLRAKANDAFRGDMQAYVAASVDEDVARCLTSKNTRLDGDSETFVSGPLMHSGKAAGSATQQDAENNMLVVDPIASGPQDLGIFHDQGGSVMQEHKEGIAPALCAESHGHSSLLFEKAEPVVVDMMASKGNANVSQNGTSPTLATTHNDMHAILEEPIMFENHPADSRITEVDSSPTLAARIGTGGGNLPLVMEPVPLQDVDRAGGERSQSGTGVGNKADPMFTLQAASRHGVAIPLDLRNAGRDPEKHDAINRQGVGVGEDGEPAGTLSAAFVPGVMAFEPGIASREGGHTYDDVSGVLRSAPGDNQMTVAIEADPTLAFKVRGGKEGGGKGYLGAEDKAFTVSTGQDQHIMAPALTASNNPSRSPQSAEITQQVGAVEAATSTVRRLTPRECERLQGFPDDYTLVPVNDKGKMASDGPRYKALGNSMAVPVMGWIGRRVQMMDTILKGMK